MNELSLPSKERLKKERDFKLVFSAGKVLFSSNYRFRATFLVNKKTEEPGIKIAPAISRKAGNAVWRNRMKRLIKESYRLNKEKLMNNVLEKNISLMIVFSLNNMNEKSMKKVGLNDVMSGIVDLMNKINNTL